MRSRLILLAVPLLATACVTTPEVDPVQVRLDDIDARVGRIDRIVSNQSLIQMSQQLDALQNDLRALRGRIEELQNENVKLRKEQQDLYADLSRRVADAAAAAASATAAANAAATAPRPATPPAPVAADEQAQYARALDELRARNNGAAIEILRNLATTFPRGALADNTQYWLGEAYYANREYEQAAAVFQGVISNWPESNKVPDALLKLGYTQAEQGRIPAARTTLQQVITKHPASDAAKKATERLGTLPKQ